MKNRTQGLLSLAASAALLVAFPAHAGKTLDTIRSRGQIVCGVNTGLAGVAAADSNPRSHRTQDFLSKILGH